MSFSGLEASHSPGSTPRPSPRATDAVDGPTAPTSWRRWAWRRPFDYVVAALAVSLAALINIGLYQYIAPQVSPLFFAAVMVAAWFGGIGPGLFATAFAAFLSVYLFTRPFGSLQVNLADLLRLTVFLMVALLTSWLTDRRDRAEAQLRMAHGDLEQRVARRTAELSQVNDALRQEVQTRRDAERDLLAHQRQLSELASQVSLSEERERRRIATMLHDDVGQMLSLAQMRLEQARQAFGTDRSSASEVPESLDRARELLEQAIVRARGLTCELSPPILYELGLEAAIEWLIEQTRPRTAIGLSFETDSAGKPLSEHRSIVLFQAVRELLFNALKHSRATSAGVRIRREGADLRIIVHDDGVGFDAPQTGSSRNSFGLFNVRERLRHERGCLQIDSDPGRGSRLLITVPLEPQEQK